MEFESTFERRFLLFILRLRCLWPFLPNHISSFLLQKNDSSALFIDHWSNQQCSASSSRSRITHDSNINTNNVQLFLIQWLPFFGIIRLMASIYGWPRHIIIEYTASRSLLIPTVDFIWRENSFLYVFRVRRSWTEMAQGIARRSSTL